MVTFDKSFLKLYLVLETSMLQVPLSDFIMQVVEAGVTTIQLRDKFSSSRARFDTGLEIKKYFSHSRPIFIINDSIDLALALGADGVHVGIKDIPIAEVSKIAPDLILGYSCNNFDDCALSNRYADYVGVGPVYPSQTKKDLREELGLCGVAENLERLSVPAVGIGGINLENCGDVIALGIDGIAVSSFICSSKKPYESTCAMLKKINERV